MNTARLSIFVAAVALLGGGAWYAQSRSTSATQAGPAAAALGASAAGRTGGGPQVVGVVAARVQDVPVTLEATGNVVALESVDLHPQVSAVVQSIAFREGQTVRRGELLFSFDDRAERANLERAVAQLERDKATLADAERQYKRAQELKAQGFIAQSAVDSALTQVESQQATLRLDQAAIRSADVALSLLSLRAPLSGRAGAIGVSRGSLVQPGGAPLVTIAQMDPIGVTFTLPEGQLTAVQAAGASQAKLQVVLAGGPGSGGGKGAGKGPDQPKAGGASPAGLTPASLTPAASAPAGAASDASRGGRGRGETVLNGAVNFVDNAIDSTTGTIRIKGSVANPTQQLWPGQYVKVRLVLRTLKDAVVVPQAALVIRGNERSVYVVDADDKAQLRPVQTRVSLGEQIVVEGLQGGERVVVDGKQNLRPGAAVRVAGRGAAGAASAGGANAAGDAASGTPGAAPVLATAASGG